MNHTAAQRKLLYVHVRNIHPLMIESHNMAFQALISMRDNHQKKKVNPRFQIFTGLQL